MSTLATDSLPMQATQASGSLETHRNSDFLDALLAGNGASNSANGGPANFLGMLVGSREKAEDHSPMQSRVEGQSAAPGDAAAALDSSQAHDEAETERISDWTASTSARSHVQQAHDVPMAKSCADAASDQRCSGGKLEDAPTDQHRAESAELADRADMKEGCTSADAQGEEEGREEGSGQGHESSTQLDTCNSMLMVISTVEWPQNMFLGRPSLRLRMMLQLRKVMKSLSCWHTHALAQQCCLGSWTPLMQYHAQALY